MNELDLSQYSFTECRDLRHAWHTVRSYQTPETQSTNALLLHTRELQCLRCGSIRQEDFKVWLMTGVIEKIRNRYSYADGYVFKHPNITAYEVSQQARFLDILAGREQ